MNDILLPTSTPTSNCQTSTTTLNDLTNGKHSAKQKMIHKFRQADCVCFDVDSTVCTNEAIDDLAYFCGVGAQVEKMTLQAMGGNMSFREALRRRLNIIKPSLQTIDEFNRQHQHHNDHMLTPRVEELIQVLKSRGVPVYLISGGFRLVINPVADRLGIEKQSHVFANTLKFNSNGEYVGFDENEFTSESGGKGRVIEHLKNTFGYRNVIMIGDGATDLESCPPADGFVGFGGNVVREKVKQSSDWFVSNFGEMIDQLK